jgi:hypothetical protein
MSLIPQRFLFRVAYRCCYHAEMPQEMDELFELPPRCRLDNFAELDDRRNFAEVRVAWNETGLGVQVMVQGKDKPVVAALDRLRFSDQLVLWIDTRDARTSHRASRTCHQFHFLPTGGGPDKDEPVFVQSKINRAAQDAPLAPEGAVLYQCRQTATGYQMRAFLPVAVLNGFDPEQHPCLGIHYLVRDNELGEQTLSVGSDFPYADDPTLWSVLDLVPPEGKQKRQAVARQEEE